MPSFIWTDDKIAQLRRLHAEGNSFSQIALELGCRSRSAVIGKAHRLGLKSASRSEGKAASIPPLSAPAKQNIRPQNIARKAVRKAEERREMFNEIADQALGKFEQLVPPSAKPVRFLDRGHFQCAMPQPGWDATPVAEKMVCGAPVVSGTSWCRHCLTIVGVPATLTRYRTQNALRGIAA
ncbi:MAG: hypothetical protein DI537_23870 [Stutzerimonas stutzeri]|nr:MAG: hypothetical protein DI537_23870 [Stutzerimonas stutzeri]